MAHFVQMTFLMGLLDSATSAFNRAKNEVDHIAALAMLKRAEQQATHCLNLSDRCTVLDNGDSTMVMIDKARLVRDEARANQLSRELQRLHDGQRLAQRRVSKLTLQS